ncbi:glycosyltransferase family 4 protein [Thalassotalea sp. PLHSN55]|uniref:glycosyltransferase family 4 protein n=1 Tax=Thalassotalea sp. PLHSN55 TaxID=3435888 RepID=UPI003F856EA0
MTASPNVENDQQEIELIVGNSNSNFSGVTSTMLQVTSHLKTLVNLRIMGPHHLTDPDLAISFWQVAKMCRTPLKSGKSRIFHARRVDEMIQALILKHVFGAKFKIVFSSAAQRPRSKSTIWLTRKMDAVLAMCKASASYLADKPDAIIYHGINSEQYLPAEDKAKAWQSLGYSGKYGIGILGRVRKQKGVHLFVNACIDALQKHPDFTAVVVGSISSGNEEFVNQLKEKVAQANLTDRIIFTGELPFEQIPKIFSALSLAAALSDNEGFGLTIPEAMSCEAAVLATQAGAWPEIIRDDIDGYVVPVEDQAQVTEKLNTLLSDPEKLALMGKNGRERVLAHYTVKRESAALLAFFKSLQ